MQKINVTSALAKSDQPTDKVLACYDEHEFRLITVSEDTNLAESFAGMNAITVVSGKILVVGEIDGSKAIEEIEEGYSVIIDAKKENVFPIGAAKLIVVGAVPKTHKKSLIPDFEMFGFGGFGKGSKAKDAAQPDESETIAKPTTEKETNQAAESYWPRIKKSFYDVAGPLTIAIVEDEQRFREIARMAHSLLPTPVRFVLREDFFVNFCSDNRQRLVVEAPLNISANDEATHVIESQGHSAARVY